MSILIHKSRYDPTLFRLVHLYHYVTEVELFAICTHELSELLSVKDAYANWLKNHPECIDTAL
jgi:hypothetical protein